MQKGNTEFKVGDVVQLKSGGPWMTVEDVKGENIHCVWFGWDKEEGSHVRIQRCELPPPLLKLAPGYKEDK